MSILQTITTSLEHLDARIDGINSCAYWTSVTTSRGSGLSATYMGHARDPQHSDTPRFVRHAGDLIGRPAAELLSWVFSDHPLERSIGLATINALLPESGNGMDVNAFDLLKERGQGGTVGVVGHFPFIPKLSEYAERVHVIDSPNDMNRAEDMLPECQVVCMTASALQDGAIEHYLRWAAHSYMIITGPGTPLTPLLFNHGIDALCGVCVTDVALVNRFIRQGACFKQMKGHGLELVTITKDN